MPTPADALQGLVDPALPLADAAWRAECRATLQRDGVLVLPGFLTPQAIETVRQEGEAWKHLAFYAASRHNVFLKPADPSLPPDHPRNREVVSSKGCITTDQVPAGSPLHALYDAAAFRDFLRAVLDVPQLHPYADPLSSVNLHFANPGQELGWHFDNSAFAITLMIQPAEAGGVFEYVKDVRDAERGESNYPLCGAILDAQVPVQRLSMPAGTLVLFRGRNAMHRVTPVEGGRTRVLAVLAYNTEPGVSLSESARMTFYGRLGNEAALAA